MDQTILTFRFLARGGSFAVAAVVFVVGCSSGDDSDDGDTGTSSGTGTGTETSGASSGSESTSSTNASTTTSGAGGSSTGSSSTSGSGGETSGSSDAGGSNGDASTSGGDDCESVQCLRPYECATSCDAEPSYVGCCPCDEGMVDQFIDCQDTGGDCGGDTCSADEYCAKPVGECDGSDALGSCEPMPGACTLEYAPVCGCDGMTYGNACGAASAGANVASEGECG